MNEKPHAKKAVALRYDPDRDPAPVVLGKGVNLLADKIVELAKEHNIPIYEDSDLVEVLSRLDLSAEIPPSTYVVVAEILAFVYRLNGKYK
ncbi:MAG: EscU/YscU/HrcU family type III secretion system export apparatus switch protein [Proteobacteria bacterium]|nr:EscU/YscU/HrcU family type III secretion system export apparatus switch protein [Pseudomonadota bacterium]MBU1687489.1 EscU/YscU/HrcU family type III secretion system export apparatus switch protein [Pseudomonadota bacterium]